MLHPQFTTSLLAEKLSPLKTKRLPTTGRSVAMPGGIKSSFYGLGLPGNKVLVIVPEFRDWVVEVSIHAQNACRMRPFAVQDKRNRATPSAAVYQLINASQMERPTRRSANSSQGLVG